MKIIKQIFKKNKSLKRDNVIPAKQDIILFNNSPIGNSNNDIFDLKIKAQAVKKAIDEKANTVALIGEYGSGKSSLTNILYEDNKECFEKPIYINLWDCVCKHDNETSKNQNQIDIFTKSFLYQFAAGYGNKSFSKYINQRLSKNYGKLSLSTSGWKGTKFLIGIALFLFLVLFIGKIPISIPIRNCNITIPYQLSLFLSLILLWFTLKNENFLFSLWDSQGKIEPSDTDTFEVFKEIIVKLKPKLKKRLIIIEDLDRTDDAFIVISLLKELYRFINLLSDDEKNKYVFIVSLKSEESLVSQKSNNENKESLSIYSKIFDYTVWIRPLHFENIKDIFKQLLECQRFDEDTVKNILPQLYWIMQGEGLSIREIKDRLNETFLLYSSLHNRDSSKDSVSYKKCAAVVYLQRQYPKIFQKLIQEEKRFSEYVNNFYYNDSKLDISIFDSENNAISAEERKEKEMFDNDFSKMFENKDIENDYSMYFYNYPSNAYIKTSEEKTVYDAIIKNDVVFIAAENNKKIIQKVVTEKESKVIYDACNELVEYKRFYGEIVFEFEEIFEAAFQKQKYYTMKSIFEFIKNNIEPNKSIVYGAKICSYNCIKNNEEQRNTLIKFLIEKIIEEYNKKGNVEFIEGCRISVINYFPKNIGKFKDIFLNSALPIIDISTINLIKDNSDIFNCLNFESLNSSNYKDFFLFLEDKIFTEEEKENLVDCLTKITNFESFSDIGINLKNLLTKHKIFKSELFNIIYEELKENAKEEIIDYVQAVGCFNLTADNLKQINDLYTGSITDIDLIESLEKNNLFNSSVYSRIKINNFDSFDFDAEWIQKNISEIAKIIYNEDSTLIYKLREKFIENQKISKIYQLFNEPFEFLRSEEIDLIESSDLYWATDFDRIQSSHIDLYSNYCNQKELQSDQLFSFFKSLFFHDNTSNRITDKDLINDLLSKINFSVCKFNLLTIEQQNKIIDVFMPILNLDDYKSAMEFIQKIKCHIDKLDSSIQKNISIGEEIFDVYIEICNDISAPTEIVLEFLNTQKINSSLTEAITLKLYEKEYFVPYIIGKSLFENQFFYDHNIPLIEFYKAYCKSVNYFELVKNSDLINKFYEQELYNSNLDMERIKPFMKFRQTYKLLELTLFLLKDNTDRKKYISEITHINSYGDSKQFISLITQEPYIELFHNDVELRNIVKEKLWEIDPTGKAKKGVLKRIFTSRLDKELVKKYGNKN